MSVETMADGKLKPPEQSGREFPAGWSLFGGDQGHPVVDLFNIHFTEVITSIYRMSLLFVSGVA